MLDGVQWPVASTIMYFVFPEKYTILDYRALWSLGIDLVPMYNYEFWKEYTDTCRTLSRSNNIDPRPPNMPDLATNWPELLEKIDKKMNANALIA